MTRQERVTRVFVELADTLVVGFDVIDFLHTLVERSVELLAADAAGLMLASQQGSLEVVAASSEEARVLELFELQSSQGPCMDCFTTGEPLVNIDVAQMSERWPLFAAAAAVAGAVARARHRRDEPVLHRGAAADCRGRRAGAGHGRHRDHRPAATTSRAG